MRKIIIDCDPGHDDAVAILAALYEETLLDVLAVGTVGGNHHLDKITKNAQLVLQLAQASIPLYMGSDKPLAQKLPIQPGAHGDSGMDGIVDLPELTYPVEDTFAVDAYAEIIKKHEKVTIIAMGPLTNIAYLIKNHPEVIDKIEEISLMGGGINHGNITAYAEFNIYADPEAAHLVFNSGIPILMAGLDVTEKAVLTYEQIQTLKDKNEISQKFYELLSFYHESGKQFGFDKSAIHDACAVVALTHPEWFTSEVYPVDVSLEGITRGMTCADKRLKIDAISNVKVLLDVDVEIFSNYLLKVMGEFNG